MPTPIRPLTRGWWWSGDRSSVQRPARTSLPHGVASDFVLLAIQGTVPLKLPTFTTSWRRHDMSRIPLPSRSSRRSALIKLRQYPGSFLMNPHRYRYRRPHQTHPVNPPAHHVQLRVPRARPLRLPRAQRRGHEHLEYLLGVFARRGVFLGP